MSSSVEKKLIGELAIFKFNQDGRPHYSIGQITDIELRNVWLEDPTIRSVIRQKGNIHLISGKQDTHLGKITCSAIFSYNKGNYSASVMGNVPSTGTLITIVDDGILNILLRKYAKRIFYLGNVYRSKAKLPLWFRHFGDVSDGGAGEAYHLGIFGTTGSGKSTLTKMIITAYSQYPEMTIFVIDPVGEFTKGVKEPKKQKSTMGFNIDLGKVLNSFNKKFKTYNIQKIILNTRELFSSLLSESRFFPQLTIHTREKRELACDLVIDHLDLSHVNLENIYHHDNFSALWDYLRTEEFAHRLYSTPETRRRYLERINDEHNHNRADHFYNEYWSPIAKLFQRREEAITINQLLSGAFNNNEVIIIDLSPETALSEKIIWNDTIEALVIKSILDTISWQGNDAWQKNKFLNALVILDEAHRFVTPDKFDDEKRENVRRKLLDVSRTTRKYGLGWMFISTSLSSIHKDVLRQLRIIFFGSGLSLGSDYNMLRELISDPNALKLYQTFTDPASAIDAESKQFSFMTKGPVSPLSFSGTPLFFNAFNSDKEFLNVNKIQLIEKQNDENYGF